MTYKDVNFPKLCISEDEKKIFKDYCDAKGVYLHKHVYDVLLQYTDEVKYSELSGLIRYDKRLRDTLYIYLAVLEEYFKSLLFENIDVKNTDTIYKKNKFKELKENSDKKTNFKDSNLYYCFKVDFSQLTKLLVKYCEEYNGKGKDLEQILKLRNAVMHHNFLILDNLKVKQEAEANLEKLKEWLRLLYKYLPNMYKEGFKKEIEKLNIDTKNGTKLSGYLNLEGIEWNI